MLTDLFPRVAARFLKLPLLGDCLDGLAEWLAARGFPPSRIRRRIRKAPVLETMLASEGIRSLGELTRERLLSFAPRPARMHRDLSALVRSLAAHLADSNRLHVADPSPGELLVRSYLEFLQQVRGRGGLGGPPAARTPPHTAARRLPRLAPARRAAPVVGSAERVPAPGAAQQHRDF